MADEDPREEGGDVVQGIPPTPSLMMTLGRGAPWCEAAAHANKPNKAALVSEA